MCKILHLRFTKRTESEQPFAIDTTMTEYDDDGRLDGWMTACLLATT